MKLSNSSYTIINGIKTNKELIVSTEQFLEHVKYIDSRWNSILWFRGLSHSRYSLKPSIYRPQVWRYSRDNAIEVYTEYVRRGKSFGEAQAGYWEWYYLMQHYGVPTRLLDWTEGALIGLFFALRKVNHLGVPCVWVLDPHWLNEVSCGNEKLFYTDPAVQDEEDRTVLKSYEDEKKLPDYPVAVLPLHMDRRIISQKSVFTIHGKERNGYLDLCKKRRDARLIKLRIDNEKARSIMEQIISLGITESSLFPDLEGLAREIKWEYSMR